MYTNMYIFVYINTCIYLKIIHSKEEYGKQLWCTWFSLFVPEIGMVVKVFTNGSGSIPSPLIPIIQRLVLDASLLNTQHYKVWIKGEMEQSRGRSSVLPYILV